MLADDLVDVSSDPLQPDFISIKKYDFAISFGYRHIISQECIEILRGNILNVHISLLPWNRGSDPNIWSWLENSPKGVSIHWITKNVDAGDIAIQKEVQLHESDTLLATYEFLQFEAALLLNKLWNDIGVTKVSPVKQNGQGTFHRKSDLKAHEKALTNGYLTRCTELLEYGRENNLWIPSN